MDEFTLNNDPHPPHLIPVCKHSQTLKKPKIQFPPQKCTKITFLTFPLLKKLHPLTQNRTFVLYQNDWRSSWIASPIMYAMDNQQSAIALLQVLEHLRLIAVIHNSYFVIHISYFNIRHSTIHSPCICSN